MAKSLFARIIGRVKAPIGPTESAVLVVTGGGTVLALGLGISPKPTDPLLPWWVLWWIVIGAGLALLARGLWGLFVWALGLTGRSVQLAREKAAGLPHIRIVMVRHGQIEQDTTPEPALSGEIHPVGDLSLKVIPGAPRPGLTTEEAIRGWEKDQGRLKALEAEKERPADEPPESWTAPFWKGKPVLPCPRCTYRTISDPEFQSHVEAHGPTPEQEREVYREPQRWAKVPIRFLGDGSAFQQGVPADATVTLYATDARADELEATGLYKRGEVEIEHRVVEELGRGQVRCLCGWIGPGSQWGGHPNLPKHEETDGPAS